MTNLLSFSSVASANPTYYFALTGSADGLVGTAQAGLNGTPDFGSTTNTGPAPQAATFATPFAQSSANLSASAHDGDVLTVDFQANAASNFNSAGQSGVANGAASTTVFGEITGPDNGAVRGRVDISLSPKTVVRSGDNFPLPGQCFADPQSCLVLNYGYTIIDVNGQYDCSGISGITTQCQANSTVAATDYFSLNTPFELRLSATAVASGQGAASVEVGININVGIESVGAIEDLQNYTATVGPVTTNLAMSDVPEPASLWTFGLAVGSVWLCRRHRQKAS